MLKMDSPLYANDQGVALIEFALCFPVLLLLVMGGIEVTNLAVVHAKLNHIAESAADDASRVRSQVDENDIDELFSGVSLIGQSIDFATKGRVVLSSIQDNGLTGSKKGQWIRWQRCYGSYNVTPKYGTEGKGKTDGTLANGMGATGRKIGAVPGSAVLFAEVTYDYDPMIFKGFISSRVLRYESAFNVRERTEFGITNTRSLSVRSC